MGISDEGFIVARTREENFALNRNQFTALRGQRIDHSRGRLCHFFCATAWELVFGFDCDFAVGGVAEGIPFAVFSREEGGGFGGAPGPGGVHGEGRRTGGPAGFDGVDDSP